MVMSSLSNYKKVTWFMVIYSSYFEKVVRKKCKRQSRKVIWDMINTLFLTTVAVKPTFVAFHNTRKHMSVASRAIISISFGEQGRQNHPQYLSGLSCALFLTTFLETAVYLARFLKTLPPNGPFVSNIFFFSGQKQISKLFIIKTKRATIAFFSFPPFLLLALSFSPFLSLHYCDFGAYRA